MFDKPFRKINKGQLVNTVTKKNAIVEVFFNDGKHDYRVLRGIKPNKFEIRQDGKLLEQDAAGKDQQAYLEEHILRCNHKSFCQVVVLGSASYIPFLDLSTPQRREVVENILDLELFSIMNVLLKKKKDVNKAELTDLMNQKTLLVDRIKIHSEKFLNQKSQNEADKSQAKGLFVQYRVAMEAAEAKLRLIVIPDSVDQELKIISEKINKTFGLVSQFKQKMAELKKEISFYSHSDSCEVCKQEIDKEFKTTILDKKTKKLGEIEKAFGELETKYHDQTKEKEVLQGMDLERDEIIRKKTVAETEKNAAKGFMEIYQKNFEEIDKRPLASEKDLEEFNPSLEQVNKELDEAYETENSYKVLTLLLKDDGTKAKVISQNIELINTLINEYLEKLDFLCQFNLDEKFNETIKSRYRDEFTFASFSEGEKLRITLAVLFTWREIAKRRNSINANILFFDEILDSSLDDEGIENFLNIIKTLTEGQNCFIITHSEKTIEKIDNQIEFVKRKGFSHVKGQKE